MISDTSELKDAVRDQTGYDTAILSPDELTTALNNAKRHIRVSQGLPPESEFNWFLDDNSTRRNALYWCTCLFAKLQVGELDAQTLQVGAIDVDSLLAKDNNEVTQWYRNARSAMRSISPGNIFQSVSPGRRSYSPNTLRDGNVATGSGGGISNDDVDVNNDVA